MNEYDYEIKYKKATLNNNADALSRNPPEYFVLPLIDAENNSSSDESIFSAIPTNCALVPYNNDDECIEMTSLQNSNKVTIEEIHDPCEDEYVTSSNSDKDDEGH